MNLSGESIRKVVDYFVIKPTEVLVVVDEVNLELGDIRFKQKGGAGGHNGLKSCQAHLKTQEFPRLRIGIGGPASDLSSHVLGEFSKAEKSVLNGVIFRAAEAAELWIKEDNIQMLMNTYNGGVHKQNQ